MSKDEYLITDAPLKALTVFAMPMILGSFFQQVYNMADSIIVGQFVGSSALAAVGACAALTNVFICVALGAGVGAGVLVSRYFGVAEFAQFANGFMELPFAGVIIAVIASVMLPEFSRMYAAGTAKEEYILLWNRTVFQSASLIYPISIFCFIFAEDIITCLYGPKYGIASDLFRIITIINIARILPYRPIMFALGKGKLFADIHLFTAVLVVGLDIACVNFFPSVTGIALISTGTTLLCLYLLMMSVSKMLGTNVGSLMPWRKLGILLVCSLCSGLASKTATTIFGTATHGMSLGLGGIVFILGYGCLSYLAGIRISSRKYYQS